jgi:hypothetical protein
MLTLTSAGGSACQRPKSLRWRALARLSAIRSVSTFGGRRRVLEAVTRLPFLHCGGPSGRRRLFLFCSLFGKTERHVKILFF